MFVKGGLVGKFYEQRFVFQKMRCNRLISLFFVFKQECNNRFIKILQKMLSIKEKVVSLKGISLRGCFQLYNPSQNLAVIFQIVSPPSIEAQISPKRGIIMQQEAKKIKVWIRDSNRDRMLSGEWEGQKLKISMTMKAEYNRKVYQKLQLKGWEQLSQSYDCISLPIVVSSEARSLRSSIQDEASNSLSKSNGSRGTLLLNSRGPGQTDSGFEQGKVYTSSITHSNKSNSRRMNNRQLDNDLDFIFEFDQAQRKERSQRAGEYQGNRNIGSMGSQRNLARYQPKQENNILRKVTSDRSGISDIPSQQVCFNPCSSSNNKRFMEALFLAILAGFFLALGSNLKNVFQ